MELVILLLFLSFRKANFSLYCQLLTERVVLPYLFFCALQRELPHDGFHPPQRHSNTEMETPSAGPEVAKWKSWRSQIKSRVFSPTDTEIFARNAVNEGSKVLAGKAGDRFLSTFCWALGSKGLFGSLVYSSCRMSLAKNGIWSVCLCMTSIFISDSRRAEDFLSIPLSAVMLFQLSTVKGCWLLFRRSHAVNTLILIRTKMYCISYLASKVKS